MCCGINCKHLFIVHSSGRLVASNATLCHGTLLNVSAERWAIKGLNLLLCFADYLGRLHANTTSVCHALNAGLDKLQKIHVQRAESPSQGTPLKRKEFNSLHQWMSMVELLDALALKASSEHSHVMS